MESNQRPMTIKDILIDVSRILGEIEVPASKIEKIGIPIAKSINGIQVCIDAMNKEEAKKNETPTVEEESNDDDPKIEVVEVGTV